MKRKIFYSIVTKKEVTGVKKQDGYEISAHGMKFNAYKSRDGFVYIIEPAIGISIFENNYYGCRGTREIDIPEEYELVITAKEEFEKRIPKERILNLRKTKEYRIMKRMFKSFKRGKELQEKIKRKQCNKSEDGNMSGAYFNGKFVKKVRCWKCNSHFYSNRSDAMFCSKECRLAYYRDTRPRMRDIKCSDCSNRSDRFGECKLWMNFKGKTHPKGCNLV